MAWLKGWARNGSVVQGSDGLGVANGWGVAYNGMARRGLDRYGMVWNFKLLIK